MFSKHTIILNFWNASRTPWKPPMYSKRISIWCTIAFNMLVAIISLVFESPFSTEPPLQLFIFFVLPIISRSQNGVTVTVPWSLRPSSNFGVGAKASCVFVWISLTLLVQLDVWVNYVSIFMNLGSVPNSWMPRDFDVYVRFAWCLKWNLKNSKAFHMLTTSFTDHHEPAGCYICFEVGVLESFCKALCDIKLIA